MPRATWPKSPGACGMALPRPRPDMPGTCNGGAPARACMVSMLMVPCGAVDKMCGMLPLGSAPRSPLPRPAGGSTWGAGACSKRAKRDKIALWAVIMSVSCDDKVATVGRLALGGGGPEGAATTASSPSSS